MKQQGRAPASTAVSRPAIPAVAAILLAVTMAALPGLAARAAASAPVPAVRPYRITMLLFRGCEDACEGFRAYFRHRNIPAEISLRDVEQDKRRVAGFVREIERDRPDLVVTFGTTVTQEVLGAWNSPGGGAPPGGIPVVFMIVSDPVAAQIVQALDRPRRNVTGTLYLLPVATQLEAARRYLPFRRVGFIVNPAESNSLSTRDELRRLASGTGKGTGKGTGDGTGFELVERTLPVSAAGAPDAGSLPEILDAFRARHVDLVYLGPDSFLNSRRDELTAGALARQLPVFAAAEAPVRAAQALFGVVNKYADVGRFTAAQALRVLRDKQRPEAIPLELPRNFSVLINLPVALQLGLVPPLDLLDVAEIVGIDRGP